MKPKWLLILLIFFSACFGLQCAKNTGPPVKLAGVWKTSEKGYSDESIEFTYDKIIIKSQTRDRYEYAITKVKSKKAPEEQSVLYNIYCIDQFGEEDIFSFYYAPLDGGTLRYKNRKNIIWKKVGG